MGKIFYIMGKSSSGKDTIYQRLLKNNSLMLKNIILYTTRPIRANEVDGVAYHFVNEEILETVKIKGKLIELREYHTFYGIWKYFTVYDEQIDLENNNYLIIGTLESYIKTKKFFGEEKIVPLLIELDDGVRLQRALDREKLQENPGYEEMCRRFLADTADFSEESIEEANITKRFYNDNLDRCLEEIADEVRAWILKQHN